MPYNKQVERVLAGGINLRARPTEISGAEHQKLINAAWDQEGGLRSRKGHDLICTASGNVKQMIKALGARWQATDDAYIVGFKKNVWRSPGGVASKDCSAIISQSGMRKSNGTSDWRWIPEAPTQKPTIKTAEDVVTTVDDFSGGWTVDPPETTFEFDENGLQINGTDGLVVAATKTVSLNLSDGFDIDDIFKIVLRAKHWSRIAGVSFEVDVGDGTFTNDYYRCRMPLKDILAAKKESITIYIRKRPQDVDVAAQNKFRYGSFERVGQTTDRDWRSVVALRVKIEFTERDKFWFTSWDMIGNEDNTLEGDDYQACYTYDTKDGHESNPSPWSDPITVNHGSINVSDMVNSSDPQVTKKHVYLRGGTLGLPYRADGAKEAADSLGDPADILDDTYTIIASADDLTNFDVVLEEDHDDPPNAEGIAGPYYGRILAWKGTRFYWSHQNKPFAFTNPDGPDGDWADIDENAGNIKYISIGVHEAWIYAENEIYILVGDPADAFGEVHPSGIKMGTPSRTGVAKIATGGDVAYLGTGIYLVDGSVARKISSKIEPIFQGRSLTLWDGTTARPVEDPSTVAVGYDDGIVWVSHSNGTLINDLISGRWFQDSRLFSCFQAEGEAGILGGQSNGKVLHLNFGSTDAGSAIAIDFLSKAYDFGINDNEKVVEDVTIYHDTAGQNLTASVYYAEGLGVSTTLNSFGRSRTVIQLNDGDGIRARNFAVGITGNITSEVVIDSIDFNYYSEPREAKSYDTGAVNAGTNKVKLIRELRPRVENDNTISVRLDTDVPGYALTLRETKSIGTNLFRRAEPLVMTSEHYGHIFRVVASSNGGHFHMAELEALIQVIGTFLRGQAGEYYLSDPLDFGSERVKLIKEIEIVYSTVGTVALTLSTDLPGNAIVSRGTATLPATLGEQSIKIPTAGTIKGRLYQLRLAPTVDCRIEAIRFFMKTIGAPNATGWSWVDLPMEKTQDAIWVSIPFPQDQVA